MTPSRPIGRWTRRLLFATCAALAWLAWVLRVRRRVVLQNLRLAFPEASARERHAIARATYRNLGRMAPEFLLAPRLPRAELEGLFEYEGWGRYEAARARGKGVIACTAHFGNFEMLAAVHTLRGIPITMISRPMGRSRLNDLWRRARARAGVEDLVVRRGETLSAARRALARGRVLGYVIDQNQPLRRAVFPTFFGVPAATSPTPALLALRSGAAVVFTVAVPRSPPGRDRGSAGGATDGRSGAGRARVHAGPERPAGAPGAPPPRPVVLAAPALEDAARARARATGV
jgi:KDO2-lipid IV(A) lauroyltransferase